ncbi:UDP-glycosyltransferase 83A1 [Vicia villosa]|uniref:UDP-glycosyltransferase 83A1 n=1 Tax=Vicia villosa TaxID=3911 RepID=UPI00273B98CE|nr:UDP-glycosyltransferase 83A1 [Vicia villosa]
MEKAHVMVVPYPVQGHAIPLMELSLYLVKNGIKVTFVNTKQNHDRIKNLFPCGNDLLLSEINLVWISDGLESAESVLNVMPKKVEELIECIHGSENEKITCVLADQSIGWALEIAEKKGIACAAFCPASAAQLVLGLSIQKLIDDGVIDKDGTPLEKQVIQLSPTMPCVSTENLVWLNVGNKTTQKHIFQLMMKNINSMHITKWLICNSSHELEPAAFSLAPKIIPIGPIFSNNQYSIGNFRPQDQTCLKWLDEQSPNSVIYIAFGSFTTFSSIQFQELCFGLERSNRPFLWVVQMDKTEPKKNVYPKGFEERIGKRGRMVGWSPQKKILSHSSVACFISHCGWNSTLESVGNGIPMLCWPYFADQFLNRGYVCDVWKVGMELEKDESGVIRQDEIVRKIEQVLNDEDLKGRAKELKEKVKISIGEDGVSNYNLLSFIKWIKNI